MNTLSSYIGARDNTIRAWDYKSHCCIREIKDHNNMFDFLLSLLYSIGLLIKVILQISSVLIIINYLSLSLLMVPCM